MAWTLARSLRAAFDEANRLHPTRSRASDGTIGDQAHASRTSDHPLMLAFGSRLRRDLPAGSAEAISHCTRAGGLR